ncbi:MAG: glucose-6-phosphate dehydrogenase [Microbacterium sp. 71-36]|uniref:glucose-6-phosphate dehydrogenase n=1 Tax=unclassified Microbacterium TaxID=2609290 RepID=UPI00086C50FC|nr:MULTISPECIES: glucose-6-phosphate dehydrogenase [unclassified Microbacterium]MBN9210226.1 glucose-6-phosphate dehydrogenase [Microbacterium sp.]ODT42093.1 MAG: glucose-6-phosphate dehydrogenase [Microbacterium sp. SCN 71-17]OJV77385.1 MAG: glucose-6-phosphate dehydrogenase [Microbacterium sp. 71-36]
MKIVSSADWRDAIAFDVPVVVADVVPGEPTRCVGCGADGELLERTELWAVKHRHPKHHGGFVRFYCDAHKPAPAPAPAAPIELKKTRASAPRAERRPSSPKATPVTDRPTRAMCPDCFVEVSAGGDCGMCGAQVV